MKQFNKFLLLFACLSLSNMAFSMDLDLAEEIENLKDQIETLQKRLSGLEKQQAATTSTTALPTGTFQVCGKKRCGRITFQQYNTLRSNPNYTCRGGTCRKRGQRGGRRGGTSIEEMHKAIQQQFLTLEKKYDIETTPAEMKEKRLVTGLQGTQIQFNIVRSALNALLAKPTLSDSDITAIKQKIAELKRLNPARWPRAEDYQRVLDARQ